MRTRRAASLLFIALIGFLASSLYNPREVRVSPTDRKYGKPTGGSTIPFYPLMMGMILVPLIIQYTWMAKKKIDRETNYKVCLGFLGACLFTVALTENMKNIVGRPRPDFLARCMPDRSGGCTGDKKEILKGRQSFPSGHTSSTFCSITFLAWFCHMIGMNQTVHAMMSCSLVLLGAAVGLSRILDHKHFISDVLGGAVFGIGIALFWIALTYKDLKRAVWEDGTDGFAEGGAKPLCKRAV